ncbi:hypothetical protein D1007_25150 [Hordeum vulgare]|nr:hypothetical protein D1007_25150 [Hordeum vulgare]
MDARAGSPLTPSYNHEPSAAAAAANPSAGSVGLAFAFARAHPSISLACGLFMPPRMTSAAGIVAPAPAPAVMKPSNIREEEQDGGRLRHLEGVEKEACRACEGRGGYRSSGELTC